MSIRAPKQILDKVPGCGDRCAIAISLLRVLNVRFELHANSHATHDVREY